jgi:hypothetical protein
MKLLQFNGGLNTREAPHLLSLNEAVEYTNIDSSAGSLKPIKSLSAFSTPRKKFAFFFSAENKWVDSDIRRDYVEYEGTLYYTDATGAHKQKNDLVNRLGIVPPTVSPAVAKTDAPDQLTQLNINNLTDSGNLPNGNLDYLLVNVDASGNYSKGLVIRVNASTTSATTVNSYDYVEGNWLGLTKIDASSGSSPRSVQFKDFKGTLSSKALLFRFYDDKFRLVAEITSLSQTVVDAVANISSNAALDNTKFGPLQGTYTYVYTYYNKIDGTESAPSPTSPEIKVGAGKVTISDLQVSTDIQVTHKRIYRVGGQQTKFVLVGEVTNNTALYKDELKDADVTGGLLQSTNYDAPPAGLTYLTQAYAMLFGAVGSKLYYTPIGVPNAWPGDYFIECVETITGLAVVANGLLVFTKLRTLIVSGTGPTSLSKSTLSMSQGCISHDSIANIDGAAYWVSTDGICASNGNVPTVLSKDKLGKLKLAPIKAVMLDQVYYLLQAGGSILALDFRYTPLFKQLQLQVDMLQVGDDTLYGWYNGNVMELFAGDTVESFKYLSPKLSDGRVSEKKTYKKVYIYSKGAIQLKMYIEDKLVGTYEFLTQDAHEFQPPQPMQRGCFVQFEITGTGEVLELEYVAGNRKDGT